ncbi:MAG: peptidylprolyl isomerase [Patescibacteria group bacterium]
MNIQQIISIIIFAALLVGGYYFMTNNNNPPEDITAPAASSSAGENLVVVIETRKGSITVALRPDAAPKTVANFLSLVDARFYDGLTFHRVEPNFVVQGGDPTGDGTGGSDASIPLEIKCKDGAMIEGAVASKACEPILKHTDGALAMARTSDPNSATSQFYITNGAQSFLDGNYAVFGYVTDGMDIVRSIQKGDSMMSVRRK